MTGAALGGPRCRAKDIGVAAGERSVDPTQPHGGWPGTHARASVVARSLVRVGCGHDFEHFHARIRFRGGRQHQAREMRRKREGGSGRRGDSPSEGDPRDSCTLGSQARLSRAAWAGVPAESHDLSDPVPALSQPNPVSAECYRAAPRLSAVRSGIRARDHAKWAPQIGCKAANQPLLGVATNQFTQQTLMSAM